MSKKREKTPEQRYEEFLSWLGVQDEPVDTAADVRARIAEYVEGFCFCDSQPEATALETMLWEEHIWDDFHSWAEVQALEWPCTATQFQVHAHQYAGDDQELIEMLCRRRIPA